MDLDVHTGRIWLHQLFSLIAVMAGSSDDRFNRSPNCRKFVIDIIMVVAVINGFRAPSHSCQKWLMALELSLSIYLRKRHSEMESLNYETGMSWPHATSINTPANASAAGSWSALPVSWEFVTALHQTIIIITITYIKLKSTGAVKQFPCIHVKYSTTLLAAQERGRRIWAPTFVFFYFCNFYCIEYVLPLVWFICECQQLYFVVSVAVVFGLSR